MARSPDGPADEAELLRLFQEQVTHLEHAAATALAQRLLGGGFAASGAFSHPAPPSARRPRRPDVVTLRVRVDLQHPRPPLWRRLELASGTMLNELHTGSRARGPPRRTAGRRRDRLTLRLRLRRRLDAHPEARGGAAARRLDTAGRVHGRPGAPEDCGGVGGYEMWCVATDPGHPEHVAALAEITDMYGAELEPGGYAPTPFDRDEINMALAGPTRGGIDLPAALADLVRGVGTSRDAARLEASITDIPRADAPAAETAARAVRPFVRLLDHVGADGIPLTGAGYLPPVHVRALAEELGITDTWIGELNREVQTVPVLAFRDAAQRAKLVRKHRGTLVPTPAGRTLRTGPVGLWWHLATHLPVGSDECERQAGLLLLIGVAAGWADDRGPLTRAGALLASTGRRTVVQQLGALEPSAAFARAAVWTWP